MTAGWTKVNTRRPYPVCKRADSNGSSLWQLCRGGSRLLCASTLRLSRSHAVDTPAHGTLAEGNETKRTLGHFRSVPGYGPILVIKGSMSVSAPRRTGQQALLAPHLLPRAPGPPQ